MEADGRIVASFITDTADLLRTIPERSGWKKLRSEVVHIPEKDRQPHCRIAVCLPRVVEYGEGMDSSFPIIRRLSDLDHEAHLRELEAEFPGSHYGDIRTLEEGLMEKFEDALTEGSEEAIQRLFTTNPYLLQYVVPQSGHHGTWVFPKQMIRAKAANGTPGLIPDFLVATCGSLGYKWQIVELKKASVQFAKPSGKSYTRDASDGIAQCATYRAHFANYIETVRSNIGISQVIIPDNVILVIGDATRETNEQRVCRAEFDSLGSNMMVASYDRIRRGLANDLGFRRKTDSKVS